MREDRIRVIKLGKQALFEFIYENFIDDQETFFDIDPIDVIDSFDMDWDNGQFIFCVHKSEDNNGNVLPLPKEIDLQKIMRAIPDTTETMFSPIRYREYTKDELVSLSKKKNINLNPVELFFVIPRRICFANSVS